MKESSKDKMEGGLKETKGKIKEGAGRAVNNPDMENEGTAEKMGGKIQKKAGDIKKVFEK